MSWLARLWRERRNALLLAAAALALAATFLNPGLTLGRPLFDEVIVLDITQSMNVTDRVLDGKPVSRLAFAKHALRQSLPIHIVGAPSAPAVMVPDLIWLLVPVLSGVSVLLPGAAAVGRRPDPRGQHPLDLAAGRAHQAGRRPEPLAQHSQAIGFQPTASIRSRKT